jgi:potassium/hydrogen antiporter
MMDVITIFFFGAMVIFIGFIAEMIFDKTGIPDIFWLMLLGVAIGYYTDVSKNPALTTLGPVFTTFALIFILFEGVLSINLHNVLSGVSKGIGLTAINFLLSIVACSAVMWFLGWNILYGLLLGAILSDASQAVIVPLLKKINVTDKASLLLTFECVISDIFVIVGSLAIINIIVLNSFSALEVMKTIIYSFVFALIIGILSGFLWTRLLPHMDKYSKSYLTTIAALLLLYGVTEYLKANGPLACLAFGIVVGNSKKIAHMLKKETGYNMSNSAKFFYYEISFFLKTFFFVYIGLVINIRETRLIAIGFLVTIVLFIMRSLAVYLTTKEFPAKEKAFFEVLNPKGLAAAVVAQLPLAYGIEHGAEFPTIVMSAIVASTLISIAGVFLVEKTSYEGIGSYITRLHKQKEPGQHEST